MVLMVMLMVALFLPCVCVLLLCCFAVTGGYVAPDAVLGGSGGGAGSAGPRDESIAFSPDELIQQVSLSLPFKLHALVAVGVAALCFVRM